MTSYHRLMAALMKGLRKFFWQFARSLKWRVSDVRPPQWAMRLGPGRVISLLVTVALTVTAVLPSVALAGTVGLEYVWGLNKPDTRGGIYTDNTYVWIADHKDGLWRADKCDGDPYGDVTGNDKKLWDIWHSGSYIYGASEDKKLFIYNDSTGAVVGSIATQDKAYGVYAIGNYAYVASDDGLEVYDVSTPSSPSYVRTVSDTLKFVKVRGAGDYVYATAYSDDTLRIFDISFDASNPSLVGTYDPATDCLGGFSGDIRGLYVDSGNNLVYFVNDRADLYIVNVSTPSSPSTKGYLFLPGGNSNWPAAGVYVRQDYAYMTTADGNDKGYLYWVDVSDTSNPTEIAHLYDAQFGFNEPYAEDCWIYVAAHDGLKVYKMSGWQPDNQIKNDGDASYIGDDIYNDDGTDQTKSQDVYLNGTATFQIKVENDANRDDEFTLDHTSPEPVPSGWTVQYSDGATDVTTQVMNGTYSTGVLSPGGSKIITLMVTPDGSVSSGECISATLRSVSGECSDGDCPSGSEDVVVAHVCAHASASKTFNLTITGCEPESVEYTVSLDDGDPQTMTGTPPSCTFTGLIPGESYSYSIKANDTEILSGATEALVEGENVNDLSYEWPCASKTFNLTITGCEPEDVVYKVSLDAGDYQTMTGTPPSYTFTGLVVGQTYSYSIKADGTVILSGTTEALVEGENVNDLSYEWPCAEKTFNLTITGCEPDGVVYKVSLAGGAYQTMTGTPLSYTFTDLTPGQTYSYSIKADGTEILSGTTDPLLEGTNVNDLSYDWPCADSITAHKFNDLNGDGDQDIGEPDLSNWTMTLYSGSGCTGDPLQSGLTDSNGNVTFSDLEKGNYSVKETLKDDWTNTTDICQNVTLSAGGSQTVNFGNAQTCTKIYGYKWDDYSHDGEWDKPGEPTLNGWTINLAGPESGTTVTGTGEWPEGYYEFRICTSGDYIVSEDILTEDWHRTFPPDPGTYTVSVDVQNGPYGPYNFGNAQTCTIIYGYKWNDYDYDGEWDKPDEPPLEDWEIHLDGPVTDVAYTNATGYYEFTICDVFNIFTVSEVVRGGYTQSYPSAPGTHEVEVYDLKKEGGYGPYDFGNRNPVPVGGIVIPVNKLAILAPWIALFAAIVVGAAILTRRRKQGIWIGLKRLPRHSGCLATTEKKDTEGVRDRLGG